MDQNNLQATVTHILDYEGKSKPGLYMDTTQHLTTGPGINVNRKADFMAQNFLDQAGNEIDNATKSKDFDTFLANRNATGQANAAIFNQYQFPPKDFESFVTKRVEANEPQIRAALGKNAQGKDVYDDTLTDGQRTVLHDVAYANGIDGFLGYHKLIDAARRGDARGMADESSFTAGKANGFPRYNFKRLVENRALAQGTSEETERKYVAEHYADNPNLPPDYKSLITKQRSDAGDSTVQQADNNDPPTDTGTTQTVDASVPDQAALPDDTTMLRLTSAPDLPPNGTTTGNYLTGIVPDGDTVQMAAMGKAIHSDDDPGPPENSALTAQADAVPDGAASTTFAQDLTGDTSPLQFAAMGAALNAPNVNDDIPAPSDAGTDAAMA